MSICGFLVKDSDAYKSFKSFDSVLQYIKDYYTKKNIESTSIVEYITENTEKQKIYKQMIEEHYNLKLDNDTKIDIVYKTYNVTMFLTHMQIKNMPEELYDHDFIYTYKKIVLKYKVMLDEYLKFLLIPNKKFVKIPIITNTVLRGDNEITEIPLHKGFDKYIANTSKNHLVYKEEVPVYIIKI